MTDDRTLRPRERRYAVLPKETVQLYAETVGLSALNDDVSSQLAEDVSYRLRDIIQQSYEFMRHAKRRVLTAADMNMAMKHSDIQPIYGYGSTEIGVAFQQTREGELFLVEDKEVDLVSIAMAEEHPARLGATAVKAGWLAIEGVPTGLGLSPIPSQGPSQVWSLARASVHLKQRKVTQYYLLRYWLPKIVKYFTTTSSLYKKVTRCITSHLKDAIDEWMDASFLQRLVILRFLSLQLRSGADCHRKTSVGRTAQSLSEDYLLYYDLVTKAILGTDSTVMKYALENLTASSKVAPLLAYFVNFVSNGVKTVSHDTSQLSRLLYTVKALVTNRSLFLQPKPYLTLVNQTILYCLLEPLAASINPVSDYWILRDYASILFAQTMRRWDTPTNKLQQQNKKLLGDILLDNGRPLCSHYGAIMGLLALGLGAVREILVPVLSNYWKHLNQFLNQVAPLNPNHLSDAHNVLGALLLCADYLVREERCRLLVQSSEESLSDVDVTVLQPSNIYSTLYEYLGDSLSMRLPVIRFSFNVPSSSSSRAPRQPREKSTLVEDSSSGHTGEQLLQQFLDPPIRDIRSERTSERSSPMSSDFGGVAEDDADMAIKETVSDPSRGIRLTILKRPRVRQAEDMPAAKKFATNDRNSLGPINAAPPVEPIDQFTKIVVDGNKEAPITDMPVLKSVKPSSLPGAKTKLNLRDVFEDMVVKSNIPKRRDSSSVVFVFRFQGRVQECVAPTGPKEAHRWGVTGRPALSWYHVLCRRWKLVGKQTQAKISFKSAMKCHGVYDECGNRRLTCALDLANTTL